MRQDDRPTGAGAPHRESGSGPDERRTLDQVYSLAYEELRRLARSIRRSDPGPTLSPTTLVNEAWFKLAGSPGVAHTSPLHFKRIAARAMRQVLIDAARRRKAGKRVGREAIVLFDEALNRPEQCDKDLLALEEALEDLARLHPRQATMVECRFFGGLGIAEIAELLEVSEATILRDWRAAKAWLGRELRRAT